MNRAACRRVTESYGVLGHNIAHAGSGVERSSLLPDVPQGMGARAEVLAGHVSGAT